MSDRRLRRSDVIARENREKRVTRISRQRLRGLIEEAVENVINEGFLLETSEEDDIDYLSLYKRCKEAVIPDKYIEDLKDFIDKYKFRMPKFRIEPLYTQEGLWGYAMGIDSDDCDFTNANKGEYYWQCFLSSLHLGRDFVDAIFVPGVVGYPYAYARKEKGDMFWFYKDSAMSIEDIKREIGLL